MSDPVVAPLPVTGTRCALIKGGEVVNMIVASPEDWVPDDCTLIADPPSYVTIGTRWDGKSFVQAQPK
jgi:hypothetical protein